MAADGAHGKAAAERSGPAPGAKPIDAHGHMQISGTDRCPVCAMVVVKHPKFASAIQLVSGDTYYFCGTGCMLKTWLHPEIILKVRRDQMKRAVTRDYFTGEPFDAEQAYWVAGSDIVGPMGKVIVPVKVRKNVEVFRKRHGGNPPFLMKDLTDEKWMEIKGKKPAAG